MIIEKTKQNRSLWLSK